MSMKSPLASLYLRFVHLSNALTEDQSVHFNPNHRALLEAITVAWHNGKPLSVSQVMDLDNLGSPATLHRRLSQLREQEYLEESFIEGNRRTKLLGPTQKTINYFESLGKLMRRSK